MFDYDRLQCDLVQQMKAALDRWNRETDGLYIFSLDYSNKMDSIGVVANSHKHLEGHALPQEEDYWYYKYCEEEWALVETFEEVSQKLQTYVQVNDQLFVDRISQEYTTAFYQHRDKMLNCGVRALTQLRCWMEQVCPAVLLTLNVRDYFDAQDRVAIFAQINSSDAVKEYTEHLEDFA